jgi:hypothetical protein
MKVPVFFFFLFSFFFFCGGGQNLLKEGVKTYVLAPAVSPLDSPTFFLSSHL